jgi:hypothetical protein
VATAPAAGTTFTIQKTFDYANCQNTAVTPVTTRTELLASGGDKYWVDGNTCLHLKLTDPGHPWEYTRGFTRDGMYIEEEVRRRGEGGAREGGGGAEGGRGRRGGEGGVGGVGDSLRVPRGHTWLHVQVSASVL